ncbi:GntR family transcriptional regulator [Streptomyces sp. Inha503]|uniref:GntR family transcriptional regulator n=1 Tax=Streptomyces sp. Inha503 TaxID=3383314 RepID=UPI0039A0069F
MATPVPLTGAQRRTLEARAHSRNSSQAEGLRARIVLACAEEPTDRAVARRLGVSAQMVGRWRARFLAEGLDGLADRQRTGRPRTVTEAHRDRVAKQLLSEPPVPSAAWSTRSLATATGLSQTAVSRILRSLKPGPATGDWLPGRDRELTGLLLAPPLRACAVAVSGRSRPTAGHRGRRRPEVAPVLAAADTLLNAPGERPYHPTDLPHLLDFLDRLHGLAPPNGETHVIVAGAPVHTDSRLVRWLRDHPRFHLHPVPARRGWVSELAALLGGAAPAPEVLRDLRNQLRTWVASPSGPLVWVPHITYDSTSEAAHLHAPDGPALRAVDGPGSPRPADRVADALREQIASGHFPPGERIKEAPLAARLGLSRGPVRDALRILAEDGLVELMPNKGTTIPMVTAERVLEVYAVRGALGGVLLRRLATLEPESLEPVRIALADVHRAVQHRDRSRIADADLRFQDAIARAARLRHTSLFFTRLTMQLRMFISILGLDYADVPSRIERWNHAIFTALRERHGHQAVHVWRAKMDIAVRYMVAQLPTENFDPELWLTISTATEHRDHPKRPR